PTSANYMGGFGYFKSGERYFSKKSPGYLEKILQESKKIALLNTHQSSPFNLIPPYSIMLE
ncbi:hypothetical protein ABTB81_19685, partial [Acinetobacter baumannii]